MPTMTQGTIPTWVENLEHGYDVESAPMRAYGAFVVWFHANLGKKDIKRVKLGMPHHWLYQSTDRDQVADALRFVLARTT